MNIIKELDGYIPTRHFCSPYGAKTTLLHLLPASSEVRRSMQSTVTLVMDQALVEVLICAFVTILKLINHHTAGLVTLINFLLVMFMTLNKQRTFLLVSTSSKQQKLKSSIEHLVRLSNLVTNQSN